MWGLIVAAALTFGLVKAAAAKSTRKKLRESARFASSSSKLAQKTITLDEAEDGAVLARKCGNVNLEKKFINAAKLLRKGRE